jgi:haloacetate dehalogenase
MCEDYRAGATYDFNLDEADRGKLRIQCPVLALWAGRGQLEKRYNVLDVWRGWADDVRGGGIDCGHYLAEEAPDQTHAKLRDFFRS